jgi:outer membrane protein
MKKRLLLILVCSVGMISLHAQNQKYGHVNSAEVLQAMPGVDSISIKLQNFQNELQAMYSEFMQEYQKKQEVLDKDGGLMSPSVRQIREKELLDLQNRIQEFQYSVQEDLEQKQFELVKPFQDKIQQAINDVAKENGYVYIFDTQVLLYSEGGVDITPLVRKKLGIK